MKFACLGQLAVVILAAMAAIEGSLSKWTNVMKGWQYRWFVLDDNAGLLSYYTVSYYYVIVFETSVMLRLGKSRFIMVRFESEYEVQVPSINSKWYILKDGNIQN